MLDSLIAAEVQGETVEHFSGNHAEAKERGIQETRGIPTGVAFDIHRQIERRRAKRKPAPDNLAPETPEENSTRD